MSDKSIYRSPIGSISVATNDNGILSISFLDNDESFAPEYHSGIVEMVLRQLDEYFSGTRTTFDLPLAPDGTEFEQRVWKELLSVKFGETASYLDIAKKLNSTGAIRAVGRANGANPIAIIIPCHRIVGSDGTLTGYSGGLRRKRWLLDHEARIAGTTLF